MSFVHVKIIYYLFIFFCFSFAETFGFIDTSNDSSRTSGVNNRSSFIRRRSAIQTSDAFIPSSHFASSGTSISHIGEQPYFDFELQRNVTVTVGQTGFLRCRVEQLGDKDVSTSPFCVLFFYFRQKVTVDKQKASNRKVRSKRWNQSNSGNFVFDLLYYSAPLIASMIWFVDSTIRRLCIKYGHFESSLKMTRKRKWIMHGVALFCAIKSSNIYSTIKTFCPSIFSIFALTKYQKQHFYISLNSESIPRAEKK